MFKNSKKPLAMLSGLAAYAAVAFAAPAASANPEYYDVGSFSRQVGTKSDKYINASFFTDAGTSVLGGLVSGTYAHYIVSAKAFKTSKTLIHDEATAFAFKDGAGDYGEEPDGFLKFNDVIVDAADPYTCNTFETCAGWGVAKSGKLIEGKVTFTPLLIPVTFTGGIKGSISTGGSSRALSSPASLGAGNLRANSEARTDTDVNLEVYGSGGFDFLLGEAGAAVNLDVAHANITSHAKVNQDAKNGSGKVNWFTRGPATFATGAGTLKIYLKTLGIEIWDAEIAKWGSLWSKEGDLWNRSNSVTFTY